MTINVVNTGTTSNLIFNDTGQMQWTLSPTPSATNALIIPWHQESCGDLVVRSCTLSDNQGNTYQSITGGSNATGQGGFGAINCGIFYCPSIAVSGGNVILTLAATGFTVHNEGTWTANHIEVSGLATSSTLDQNGTATSGSSFLTNITCSASGANTSANDLVVAAYVGFGPGNQFFGPSAPITGYTEITNVVIDSNSLTLSNESAYKIVSSLETSSANWTQGHSDTQLMAAVIATFKQASGGPTMISSSWYKC